jgi:hypothetical protein
MDKPVRAYMTIKKNEGFTMKPGEKGIPVELSFHNLGDLPVEVRFNGNELVFKFYKSYDELKVGES